MPDVGFLAGRDDLLAILRYAQAECGCTLLEIYSELDRELRHFPSAASLEQLAALGVAPNAPQIGLWSPVVGPRPVEQRITLDPAAVPGHAFRYTAAGCSLVTLQCGGVAPGNVLLASHLVWWTEAEARKKTAPELGAAEVDWRALASLGRRLKARIRRTAVGIAGTYPVLAQAYDIARRGAHLRDAHAPARVLALAAD